MVDVHEFSVTLLGVCAGVYFLSVVRGLVREKRSDWNVVLDQPIDLTPWA